MPLDRDDETDDELFGLLYSEDRPEPLSLSKRVYTFFTRLGSIAMLIVILISFVVGWNAQSWSDAGQAIGIGVLLGAGVQIFFNLFGWAFSALFPD